MKLLLGGAEKSCQKEMTEMSKMSKQKLKCQHIPVNVYGDTVGKSFKHDPGQIGSITRNILSITLNVKYVKIFIKNVKKCHTKTLKCQSIILMAVKRSEMSKNITQTS